MNFNLYGLQIEKLTSFCHFFPRKQRENVVWRLYA